MLIRGNGKGSKGEGGMIAPMGKGKGIKGCWLGH